MLKITVRRQPGRMTLKLEGRLAGPWVDALAQEWLATVRARDARGVVVDLTEVAFVQPAGRELLTRMCVDGARLVATGVESGPMVLGIEREAGRRRASETRTKGDNDAP
jgi:hypothetical protein